MIGLKELEPFKKLKLQLASKVYKPVYTFLGDEPYFNDILFNEIEKNCIEEANKSFNQQIYYGQDITGGKIVSLAKSLPFMGDRQLIAIKEAQNLKQLDELVPYLKNPNPATILVFLLRGNGQIKKSEIWKLLNQYVVFESKALPDYRLVQWINELLFEKEIKTDATCVQYIAECVGNDLELIDKEIQKIILNIGDRKNITFKDLEQYLGINKVFNIFELQDAILQGNSMKISKIIQNFSENTKEQPLILALNFVYGLFLKLIKAHEIKHLPDEQLAMELGVNKFFVKDYRKAMANYNTSQIVNILEHIGILDLLSKGINGSIQEAEAYQKLGLVLCKQY